MGKIEVIWQIPELRTKIILTLLMLAIYRVGFPIQLRSSISRPSIR